MIILDSRFGGITYLGDKFDAFFNVFRVLGVFLGDLFCFFWGGGVNPAGDSWN